MFLQGLLFLLVVSLSSWCILLFFRCNCLKMVLLKYLNQQQSCVRVFTSQFWFPNPCVIFWQWRRNITVASAFVLSSSSASVWSQLFVFAMSCINLASPCATNPLSQWILWFFGFKWAQQSRLNFLCVYDYAIMLL